MFKNKYSHYLGVFYCLQKSFAVTIVWVLIPEWSYTSTVATPKGGTTEKGTPSKRRGIQTGHRGTTCKPAPAKF